MRVIRRFVPLIVSVALVLGVGVLVYRESAGANTKAEAIHRSDRTVLQNTLAGLGNQYVLFSMKDMLDFVETHDLSLRPNDAGDRQLLHDFVARSATLDHGAALVGLDLSPVNAWSKAPGIPPLGDP